jgi:hypothetical protein
MNKLDKMVSVIGWIQIFISPFFGAIIIGFLIWLSTKNILGGIAAIVVLFVGIILGIRLAEKARKNKGTIDFISRINASPELDEENNV